MRVPGAALLAAALLLAPASTAPAGDRDEPAAGGEPAGVPLAEQVTVEQQKAIDRGLAFLATQQDPRGGFLARDAGSPGERKSADYQTAVTALGTLAFLGAGHGLRHGPHHRTVTRAVEWLLDAQRKEDGYISFANDSQSKMHGHGFATLALAEAYATAMSGGAPESKVLNPEDEALRLLSGRMRLCIQKAVDCIEASQAARGGWDYLPSSGGKSDHEGSVTVCQVQALLSASNRGFVVNLGKIERAREYMRLSQTAAGGFKYRLSQEEGDPRQLTYALAAAGVTSLLGLAEYDRREAIEKGLRFLEGRGRIPEEGRTPYYFYAAFYATQAFHWAGGKRWEEYWNPLRRNILNACNEDGSWTGKDTNTDLGRVYPTAFCCLILEVPVGYLSIYAR